MRKCMIFLAVAVLIAASTRAPAQTPAKQLLPNPVPYSANEPMAEAFSLTKSAKYLDVVGRFWMKDSCGSCHANYTYFMARPFVPEAPDSAAAETRRFLENRAEAFKKYSTNPYSPHGIQFESEIVGVSLGLALDDAQTKGQLQPITRQALERMWALQRQAGRNDGSWSCGCGDFPLVELDPYYCATLAALASGIAPDRYAQSPEARDGLTRLRRYLAKNTAPHLHHQAMLLWASLHLDGLMTTAERQATVQALLNKQRPDGGWSLSSLSGGTAGCGSSSDGYGTGFVTYILRQAGVPASREELVQGVRWLQSNQRASGGWFTKSPHAGHRPEGGHGTRELSLLNVTASFAVMAIRSCEEPRLQLTPSLRAPFERVSGLTFRTRLAE